MQIFRSRKWIRGLASLTLMLGAWDAEPARADILIGQTTAVTGPVAASVGETLVGVNLYLNSVNARGGVNGEKNSCAPSAWLTKRRPRMSAMRP